MKESFEYKDKEFTLSTINKQRTFYYKIKKPVEVWENYHCHISFFRIDGKLVYHRYNCHAHLLVSDNFRGFVKWSKKGDSAIFYEYKRGQIPGSGIYDYVFLLLEEKTAYRIDLYKYDYSYFDNLQDKQFDSMDVLKHILQLDIDGEELFQDK